jgi:hypothetical protein
MLQDEQKNINAENFQRNVGEQAADLSVDHAAEVEKLKQQLAEAEAKLSAAKPDAEQKPEQEPISEPMQEGQANKEAQNGFSAPAAAAPVQTQAQQNQAIDSQNQVQTLCELAFQKGLEAAIKAAQDLNNPFILDEFHDALVDKFYKQLVEQKKIEEV